MIDDTLLMIDRIGLKFNKQNKIQTGFRNCNETYS